MTQTLISLRVARIWAGALAALACATFAGAADARQCRIPRALLCENCARELTISLTRDGGCVVTARRAMSESHARDLIVRIRPAPRRVMMARAFAPARPASGPARCFVFNERRYCE